MAELIWHFSLRFGRVTDSRHFGYSPSRENEMPREEFVTKIKEKLKAQGEEKELEQRTNLHNADVIKAEAHKKWTELKTEIREIIRQACGEQGTLTYEFGHNEMEIKNQRLGHTLKVTFEPSQAAFKYSGMGAGSFSPTVVDNDLAYTIEVKRDGTQSITLGKKSLSISEIAEKLIDKVMGD
jgi:hypothetical protein